MDLLLELLVLKGWFHHIRMLMNLRMNENSIFVIAV